MDTERICKEFDTIDRLIISGIRHDGDKIILPCVYKGGDDDYLSLSAIKTVIDKINTGDEQVSLVDFSVLPMGVENIFTDTKFWIVPNLFVRIELEEATQSPKSTTSSTKLTKKQKDAIVKRLLEITEYESFEVEYEVDESLIGGLVIRIDDRVVDSSIKTKLANMAKALNQIQLA